MSNKKLTYEIDIDSKAAEQDADKLGKKLGTVGDKAKKSAESAKGAFGTLGNAIKSLGVITLVADAFNFFKETLMKNQKVADFFAVAMEAISIVITDLVNFIVDGVPKAIEFFTDLFNNPKKYLDELATGIKNNIMERIQSLIDAFGFLGDIIGDVFSGDFAKAAEDGKKFLKEAVDIATGVNDSFDKTKKIIGDVADAVVDYGKKVVKTAQSAVELRNSAALAASQAAIEAAMNKRLAEEQRQIRDDQTKSIDERIAANEKLKGILDKQLDAELKAINLKVAAAAYEKNKTGKLEDQIAYNEALAELEGKREEIAGQRSEQLQNEVALNKEKADIQKLLIENANKLVLDSKKANAEIIKDDIEKLQVKRANLLAERDSELQRLQENIDNTNAGTAARAEAEIALANKKMEIENSLLALDDQIQVTKYTKRMAELEAIATDNDTKYALKLKAVDDEIALNQKAFDENTISEETYNKEVKRLAKERLSIQDAELQAKTQFADAVGSVMGQLSGLFAQGTAASKVAALAEIAIGTGTGFINALDIAQKGSKATGPLAPFAFPIFYATQIAAVLGAASKAKSILSQVKGGGSGATPSAPSIPSTAAPIKPQLPQAQMTQLNQQSINDLGNQSIKAYVVETDMTTNQERIRAIQQRARFG